MDEKSIIEKFTVEANKIKGKTTFKFIPSIDPNKKRLLLSIKDN